MTVHPPTTALGQPAADRLAAGQHRCFSGLEAGGGLFAGEAFSGLLPPPWRYQVQGAGSAFAAQLQSIAHGPVEAAIVRTVPAAAGLRVRTCRDPAHARRCVHSPPFPPARGARRARHSGHHYCSGGWDEQLRARHAAEAPMIRP